MKIPQRNTSKTDNISHTHKILYRGDFDVLSRMKTNMIGMKLMTILIITSVIFIGFSSNAYADTPTANTASVSFDVNTGTAVMNWDFGTHTQRDYCLVKTDFHVIPTGIDPATAQTADVVGKVFLGTNTNSLYDQGSMSYQDLLADSAKVTEATIACTGSMTFNVPVAYHFDDLQLFMTFAEIIVDDSHDGDFKILDTVDHDFGAHNINTLHEITVQYSNYIAFNPVQCAGDNRWEIGTEYFKDINTPDTIITLNAKNICTQSNVGGSTDPDGSTTETETASNIPLPTTGSYYLVFPSSSTIVSGGGNSDKEHNTRPTFGLDHRTHAQIVEGGLIINNATFNVVNNYWTHIPMQNLTVGEVQNFTATTYAPKTLRVMEFLFGVPEVGAWNNAESSISIFMDYSGEITSNSTINKDDILIDFDTLSYSASKTFCSPNDSTQLCDRVSIEMIFNESPLYQVLAVQAIDWKGRNNILYFNEGLDIDGESLNPPKQMEILSELKHNGLQTIERIDKANDIWMTLNPNEPIKTYQKNSHGSFFPLERNEIETSQDKIRTVMEREHSYFDAIKEYESIRALEIFDASLLETKIGNSFAYQYSDPQDRIKEIKEIIEYEKARALLVIEQNYTHDERGLNHNTNTIKQ